MKGGGAAAPQLPSGPRAPQPGLGRASRAAEPATCRRWAAAASCAAASAGEWSAQEFEQGPEPSQRHLRSGPHLLPPTAARSVTRFPQAPRGVRPRSQSRGRLLKPPRRRRAAPRTRPRPPLARPRSPTGVVVPVREVAGAETPARLRERDRAAGGAAPAVAARPAREPGPAPARQRRTWCGRAGRGAGSCVNRFPSGDRRCLGTVGCAAAPGLLRPRSGRGGGAGGARVSAASRPGGRWPRAGNDRGAGRPVLGAEAGAGRRRPLLTARPWPPRASACRAVGAKENIGRY